MMSSNNSGLKHSAKSDETDSRGRESADVRSVEEDRGQRISGVAHACSRDLTTGLPRFGFLESYLQRMFAGAVAEDGRIIVCYLDLDRFAAINETHNHSIGDQVLRHVAD